MTLAKYKFVLSKLNFFALLLFIFWLPLKADFLPTILAFWVLTWILEANYKNRFKSFSNKSIYLVLTSYFFLTVFALFYTSNIETGLFEIQKKLSIIIFPILIIGSNEKVKKNYQIILMTFVAGNLIASIYLLSNAFFTNFVIKNGTWYIEHSQWNGLENYSFWQLINMRYSNFSGSFLSVLIHPSYFSMYLLFSITILIYFLKQNFIKKLIVKILTFLTITFFIFMIYLLQSRAGFISLFIVILFYVFFELKKHKNKKVFIGAIIFVSISLILLISSPRIQYTIGKFNNLLSNENKLEMIKQDARFETWFSAIHVIKENFWFGTSPADVTNELAKKYMKYNFTDAQIENLNTHNQYLESFAGLGIIGFLCLMLILILGFVHAYKKRHYLLFFLLLILSINFLFESMMNRMAGILFMMFFYSLFVFSFQNNFKKNNSLKK